MFWKSSRDLIMKKPRDRSEEATTTVHIMRNTHSWGLSKRNLTPCIDVPMQKLAVHVYNQRIGARPIHSSGSTSGGSEVAEGIG